MSAPATSLSLTPPLHSSLFPKPKHQKQQLAPHIAFQVQENTPHAQNAQSSAIFPGSGDLAVVAVHPRTNLSSTWWASPSSPPATRTADAAPAAVPHHRSNTKLRSRLESTRRRRRRSFAAVGHQPPSPPLPGPRCLRFSA